MSMNCLYNCYAKVSVAMPWYAVVSAQTRHLPKIEFHGHEAWLCTIFTGMAYDDW